MSMREIDAYPSGERTPCTVGLTISRQVKITSSAVKGWPSDHRRAGGSELQLAISGTARARTTALDVIEDLAALSLKFALGDGSALAKLVQLTHIGDQVHERRGKPLAQMPIFLPVKLRR